MAASPDLSADLERLVADLAPVRRVSPWGAMAAVLGALIAGMALVLGVLGVRADLLTGMVQPMFLIRAGLLALLGGASLGGVIAMARPAVGLARTGWRWALAASAVLPAAALVVALAAPERLMARIDPGTGMYCLGFTLVTGLGIGAALTWWLRRGAPTSPARAGLLTGLAAGSLGALAYSIHCPHDDLVYIGLWYGLAVAIVAGIGRLIVPPLIRW